MSLKYTFVQLYAFHKKGNPNTEYKTLEEYTKAYRKSHHITSTLEVEFDNASNPVSK